MKKFYFFFLATVFSTTYLFAQPGKLDASFGDSGKTVTDLNSYEYFNSAALQTDGKIVAAGAYDIYTGISSQLLVNAVARYKINGSLDSSFGKNGIMYQQLGDRDAVINSIAIQNDGKIVAAGYNGFHKYGDSVPVYINLTVLRFMQNGSIDSSFGKDGVVSLGVQHYDVTANALALQPDGKIVVAGSVQSYGAQKSKFGMFIIRLNNSGKLDRSFGNKGRVIATPATYCAASALALQPDGKIVIGGYVLTDLNAPVQYALLRFASSGKADLSFGNNGEAYSKMSIDNAGNLNAIALQPDGKIIAGGYGFWDKNYEDFTLIRFNSNGNIDSSFGTNGIASADFGYSDRINSIVLQPDGKIITAGNTNDWARTGQSAFAIARFNKNGKPDMSFGNAGKVTTVFEGRKLSEAKAALLQPDGKIIAAGYADKLLGQHSAFALTRYLGDDDAMVKVDPATAVSVVTIFPNPVKDIMNVKGLTANSNTILSITDRAGNVVKKTSSKVENFTWDVHDLQKGYYYLVIQNNNNRTSVLFMKE